MSSLIKEINRSVTHLLLWKTDILKTSILLGRKFEEMHFLSRAKRQRYICGIVGFGIIVFSCLSFTKPCLRFLLICFDQEIKGFYQGSLGKEGDSTDIMNISPNFPKTETWFCRKKSNDYNGINIFLSPENPRTFLLAKEKAWKRIFKTNSELSQNRTEKQIMTFKTILNWLFHDICYLFIDSFDWKFCIFQQTIVRGILYPYV